MINTTLAPAAAGLTAMMCAALGGLIHGKGFKLYLTPVLNGILAGLVSITAGCGDVSPWAAVMLGAIGGVIYSATSKLQLMLKIDDVVDAGPVHFWCGIWGVLGFALFADDRGTGLTGAVGEESGVYEGQGVFYGGGSLFAHNLALVAMIIIWVAPTMAAVFFILKLANVARVSAEIEEVVKEIANNCHIAVLGDSNREIKMYLREIDKGSKKKITYTKGSTVFGVFKDFELRQMQTLDQLVGEDAQFDLIKQDVQGAEIMIMQGAPDIFTRAKYVIQEVNLYKDEQFPNMPTVNDMDEYMFQLGFDNSEVIEQKENVEQIDKVYF